MFSLLLNTCQCCLAQECTKDIFYEYYCNGEREVYSDMLLNTLNISVPQDKSGNKICEECITELRRATEFKMKVIKSTNYFQTMTDMKLENDKFDDVDDQIKVDFDEELQPLSVDTDQDFGKKLDTEHYYDNEAAAENNSDWIEDETPSGEVTSFEKGKQEDQRSLKHKLKQPETTNHKDLKQNSLNLIFNSNLCLFKSLKTKFGCIICREAFFTIKELRSHSEKHSNLESIRTKFSRLRGLSFQNADISGLECSKCRKSCFDFTDLKKHLIEQHGIKFGEAEHFLIPYKLEDSFACVVCSDKFNTYMRLSVHMNNHYSNNVCEICGSSFINRISLRIHLNARHSEKKCTLCSETFSSNYARIRHMRSHHNTCLSKRYCLLCGKTFCYSYQLAEHKIEVHGAKRSLIKCSHCAKTFPNTQNLKIHVRSVHVRERNFQCGKCDMRFFTKFDQKRHEMTHLDEKSFSCKLCETKFKAKDSLRRHMKRQHVDA